MKPVKDQVLVNEFLNSRSEQAFRDLYRDKTPHLYQMALRLTQDEVESQELVQEMWIIAIRKLPGFEWRSELKTWLISILINLSRAKRKAQERELMIDTNVLEMEGENLQRTFANTHDLEKAIGQLPAGYRQVILLHDVEGFKHKEIAELLDISEGTSKSQLFHARKALRTFLKEEKNEKR